MMKKMLALLALATVAACAANVPRLEAPQRIESFCVEKEPRQTAVESILASTGDALDATAQSPDDTTIRRAIKNESGVVAYWDGQPLLLPAVAKALGYPDRYVTVVEAEITNRITGTDSRRVYLTLKTPAGTKMLPFRAYDMQNVCVEGQRLS